MKTINVAPHMIMVNGVIVAKTFSGFKNWLLKSKTSIAEFRNWPFQFGLSSDIDTKKIQFWCD